MASFCIITSQKPERSALTLVTRLEWQPESVFRSSTYGSLSLMWRTHRYLTLGLEYAYGVREDGDGAELDNHRIAFGVQVY